MEHVLVRPHTKVAKHLHSLSILDFDVSLFHHGLHEMLMDELPEGAPEVTILHNQQVVAPSNQFISNVRLGPVAVF